MDRGGHVERVRVDGCVDYGGCADYGGYVLELQRGVLQEKT